MLWEDIRYFLEVHRAGNLARAGAKLGVDPTTVGRAASKSSSAAPAARWCAARAMGFG
jgi:hypothetical protein